MVQPKRPTGRVALSNPKPEFIAQQVAGRPVAGVSGNANFAIGSSSSVYKPRSKRSHTEERGQIATSLQIEAYRLVKLTGEARYAVSLFANTTARAEIGVSQPQVMNRKAVWVNEGPEVEAFAAIFPDVRARAKAIRDYMTHRTIAGEAYLIARSPSSTDPQYIEPPVNAITGRVWDSWDEYLRYINAGIDVLDPGFNVSTSLATNPNRENPIWEIIGVTEIQKVGSSDLATWRVRMDNNNWVDLDTDDPVIRMWSPDPENRREAWSPILSMLPTLQEIEWETKHIFAQLKSRLMNAGVWFLPNNLTFPQPPPDSIEGGEEAIAALNESELLMMAMAEASMEMLEEDEVSFPTIITADPLALESINKDKLIQFWSEIDDKVILARSDAIRRFALGMDLMPEDVLGSSGLAVTGAGGSAGSVNHWGVWANEEKTIANHSEPALDEFVGVLTTAVLRLIIPNSPLVIAYDTASLRMKQDRSKESIELFDRGAIKAEIMVRENGFDPENDMMDDKEFTRWILTKMVSGSASPEQMQAAFLLLTKSELPVKEVEPAPVSGNDAPARGEQGQAGPRSLDDHPYEGPPREQHDHSPAPYSAIVASCEVLVLRALEKRGNIVLNTGKRGDEKDRITPPIKAHLNMDPDRLFKPSDFDFSLAEMTFSDLHPLRQRAIVTILSEFCAGLYNWQAEYTREGLMSALEGA